LRCKIEDFRNSSTHRQWLGMGARTTSGGEEMTVKRAIEILSEQENLSVDVVRPGVFTITYNGEADIVSEQNIIDLAREMEDEE